MQAAARLQTGASCWIRRHASRIVPGSAWPVWRVLPRPLRGPVLGAAAASLARSVRPVGVVLITVAKGNSKGAQLMAKEWADKLRRYTQLTEVSTCMSSLTARSGRMASCLPAPWTLTACMSLWVLVFFSLAAGCRETQPQECQGARGGDGT